MKINIVGAGRVGLTLGRLFFDRKVFEIGSVFNRTFKKAEESVSFIGDGQPISNFKEMSVADVYMVTTPDNALERTCDDMLRFHDFKKSSVVFHCSGVTPSTVFERARKKGCRIASVHPVKSFADPNISITNFDGTFCGVEGEHDAVSILERTMQSVGAKTFSINTEKKPIYHAATVMACNNLVALMEASASMYVDAGLSRDEAMAIMQPIVSGTITNIFNLGTTKALTGPIARGDSETVRKHLQALRDDKGMIKTVYSTLGMWALKLSRNQGTADKGDLDNIRDQLVSAVAGQAKP